MADDQNQNLNTDPNTGQAPTPATPPAPIIGVGEMVDLSQPTATPVQPVVTPVETQDVEVVNYQANVEAQATAAKQENSMQDKEPEVTGSGLGNTIEAQATAAKQENSMQDKEPEATGSGIGNTIEAQATAAKQENSMQDKEPEATGSGIGNTTEAQASAAKQEEDERRAAGIIPTAQPGAAGMAQVAKPVPMPEIVQGDGANMVAQALGDAPRVANAQPVATPQLAETLQVNPPVAPAPVETSPVMPEELQANPPVQPVAPQEAPVQAPTAPEPAGAPVAPAGTQTPVPNKKKESAAGQGSSLKLLFGLLGVFFFLAVAFYAVLLWGLLGDGLPTDAFAGLGLTEAGLQDTLIALTNGIFGFACLYLLMAFLVRIFQYMMTNKKDARRRSYGFKSFFNFVLFILFAGAWITLYWMISNANVDRTAQATNQSLILTDPATVTRLQSPIVVGFDIGTRLYQQVPTEQIRKIDWDFNADGKIDASGATVQYRFQDKGENEGRYPVLATVYYVAAAGGAEQVYTETVEVIIENESVSAIITPNTTQGPAPLSVNFSATASKDPDGQIIRYEWDLDEDGTYELSGPDRDIVDFVYDKVGKYTARLRVTGTNNDTAEATIDIDVQIPKNTLKAEINTADVLSSLSPVEVTLDADQSISQFGDIVRYEWFVEGEKGSSLGRKIKRTFYDEGEYQIRLVVESEAGEKAEDTIVVTVEEDLGKYEASIRTTPPVDPDEGFVMGTVPFEVAFDSSASTVKNPIEWNWDFNSDGIVDDFAPAVRNTFRTPGTYVVTLTMLDTEDNEYTSTQVVEVKGAGLQAKIAAEPTGGMVPLLVSFDGSGSTIDDGEIIEYLWQFPGAQPISYGPQIEYEFTKLGNQRVVLKVVSSTGKTAETDILISVRKAAVQADFLPRPAVGNAPLEVLFDPTPSTGTIFGYEWDFGDGKVSDEFQPKHIYRVPGTYEIKLKVTDQDGIISTETKQVIVTDPTKE